MKDRIKAIRKSAGVNQTEFAASLGLSRSFIAQVETDANVLSERSIRDICRIYRVNEEWLRDGVGEMFEPLDRNQQILAFVNDALEDSDDETRKLLLYALTTLDPSEWHLIKNIFRKAKEIFKESD